ncbi:TrkA C-terminal domain-containing protein [Ramlibacter solisilvae]|uniref:Transporter n=1 Tax=Ramlibacter tataouinensis TaxID=94132 RepID=A0A127JPC0_9BURK|nr:TrkA C-terminal domain-containing protein [Ramlibacter tataouinensis]AMO21884.1 transporter [Ramlibacter tataouinensis]
MKDIFEWLAKNPFMLLFVTVGLAVWVGKFSVKGYGLGMVAAAIVVGCAMSTWASLYGVKLELNNFAKSLFYYLFMYGVGLRVGPSFVNSLKGDGLKFTFLALLSSLMGLALCVIGARWLDLPMGAAGGLVAGSQTMSAAIGSAEQAVEQGAVQLASGTTPEQVSAMIALSYGISYIWGTVGIILICKYLPRWWGIDARAAAIQYEKENGVRNVDDAGLTGYRPFAARAYKLENREWAGKSIQDFRNKYPEYRVLNVRRGEDLLGADPDVRLQANDIIALAGTRGDMTQHMGALGPEIDDARTLNVPLAQAEILMTNKEAVGRELGSFSRGELAGQVQVTRIERAGQPIPVGTGTKLQRLDVMFVAGLTDAVKRAGEILGRIATPNTSTDLLTLSVGMILGLLIGAISFPAFGASVGLGNAGGLLVSGVIVSSLQSRLRFFGNTPNAARNILEDLGLVVFVCIVGINAGNSLLSQLTGALALKIFLVGFVACTIPPFIVWALGYHVFKINPAVLMGGVAGARSHSGPCREAAKEINSSVPWIGFPVGYAVSGILLTIFGYFAMVLAAR